MRTAKLFINGHSQAVRLPRDFNFGGKEVIIFRLGPAVILQPTNDSWFKLYQSMNDLEDFMKDREDLPLQERESL